jgi:hypothetical protein
MLKLSICSAVVCIWYSGFTIHCIDYSTYPKHVLMIKCFIGNLSKFSIDLTKWYCQHQWTDCDTENHRQVWRQAQYDITKENNNVSLECLNIHYRLYHRLSYQTHGDTSDNKSYRHMYHSKNFFMSHICKINKLIPYIKIICMSYIQCPWNMLNIKHTDQTRISVEN